MNVRPVPFVLGVGAFIGALAVLIGVVVLDLGGGALLFVGLLAMGLALLAVTNRERTELRKTPESERRHPVPVPGSSMRESINQFRETNLAFVGRSERVVESLRAALVAVLTRFEGLSEAQANQKIADGSWTDDRRAAALVSEQIPEPSKPIRTRIRSVIGSKGSFYNRYSRTVEAVANVGYTGFEPAGTGNESGQSDSNPATQSQSSQLRSHGNDSIDVRTTSEQIDEMTERASRHTGHWSSIGVISLLAIGVGTIVEEPAIVISGIVGIGYAGFSGLQRPREPSIEIERSVSDETPEPDDEIDVTVTIRNTGSSLIPDLRVVDGVPAGLGITDGHARIATAIHAGDSIEFTYTLTARRGTHVFDPALLVVRDVSGSREREFVVPCETKIVCTPVLRPLTATVPLRTTSAMFSGRMRTPEGGSGTEFHSVREYRKNDPLNRIDWNRRAKTGDLATLQFHEERAVNVLVLIDARKDSYRAPEPNAAHAVDRSVDVAGRIAASLLDAGDSVGLAALGPLDRSDGSSATEPCWLGPSSGQHHRGQFQELLATHPQLSTIPPSADGRWLVQLRAINRRLSADAQVVLLSPLTDRGSEYIAKWLGARSHAMTIVSPDPTADRTASQQLSRIARRIRRFDLQRAGIPVIDWRADETIDEAFARSNAGGSQ